MKQEKTSWGKVAEWYDEVVEKDNSYQKTLILPNLLRLINPKAGEKLLDIACGQGFFAKEFSKKDASVVASDISSELISIAKQKQTNEEKSKINFLVSSADDLLSLKLKPESFDKAYIILAIQNIENANKVWSDAYSLLKKGGELHIVINHPAFRIPKGSSWVWDEENSSQYRRVDKYLHESKEKLDMNPGKTDSSSKAYTYSFHRPLQWYFKTLTNSGFLISRLEEWVSDKVSGSGPRQKEENRIRSEIPMFMYIKAVK